MHFFATNTSLSIGNEKAGCLTSHNDYSISFILKLKKLNLCQILLKNSKQKTNIYKGN